MAPASAGIWLARSAGSPSLSTAAVMSGRRLMTMSPLDDSTSPPCFSSTTLMNCSHGPGGWTPSMPPGRGTAQQLVIYLASVLLQAAGRPRRRAA